MTFVKRQRSQGTFCICFYQVFVFLSFFLIAKPWRCSFSSYVCLWLKANKFTIQVIINWVLICYQLSQTMRLVNVISIYVLLC